MTSKKNAGQGMQFDLSNIKTDMAVVGFTGALGSGCSYLARGLEKYHGYVYCSLSKPIHDVAKSRDIEETTENLQNIGNTIRVKCGSGCLVGMVLTELSESIPAIYKEKKPVGIVVDGIRNVGEIEALQQLPNFYLISVQAETEVRQKRTIGSGEGKRFKTEDEFKMADERDRDEHKEYGQQVKECNYRADIIVINEEVVSPHADRPYKNYIKNLLYDDYISLIEHVAKGKTPNERRARPEEALMTAAYVESKRSSCLKRKVGAIIASSTGDIITAGHNEVPETSKPCIDDPRYGRCARDYIQESIGCEIKNCPSCGKKIRIKSTCRHCKITITQFAKQCPNCKQSLEIEYECNKCGKKVFEEFLPGAGTEKTGKLLDLCRALHAEENAILNLTKFGVRLPTVDKAEGNGHDIGEGCVLYSTTFPCNLCANKIVTVGIRKVVYAEPYTMEEAKKVFEERGVTMQRFQGVKSRAFFRLYA